MDFFDKRLSRQTFLTESQIGLCETAIDFENELRDKNFSVCNNILNKCSKENYYWYRQKQRLTLIYKRLIDLNCEKKLRISYIGFWKGFDVKDNFINSLVSRAFPEYNCISETYKEGNEYDILLFSCFPHSGFNLKNHAAIINVLFLGENCRPYYDLYDLSLTSDIDSYLGRNIYLPLWLTRTECLGKYKIKVEDIYTVDELTRNISTNLSKSDCRIAYVGSNNEPGRISSISKLREKGYTVDTYGSNENPIKSKRNTLKE